MKTFFKLFFEKQLRYSPFFYKRLKAVQELEKLDKSKIESLQEEKFLKLLNRLYHQSPFYASLYKKHHIKPDQIKSIRDLPLLPVITKHDVVKHRESIFIGSKLNRTTSNSSGTSGLTVRVYRDYQSVIEEGAYQWAHRIKFGHHPGMKTVVLRGNLNMREKERYDPFTKTLYLSSYHLNMENAEWYYQRIKDFAPNAILAYPSSVESLANFFTVLNKRLAVPVIFTSSETLYSYQREKIEKIFQSRIIDWYGNSERTIALKEEKDGLYDQVPLYSINEFEQDHIITTNLTNASFPLIRYKVDDVIELQEDHTQPHYLARRVKRIQGRADDVLILPDGRRVGMICNAFDGIDHILLSQVVQENPDAIDINLVVADEYSQDEEQLLHKQLEDNIGDVSYKIRYIDEEQIIKSKNGKFKLVVNKMQEDDEHLQTQVLD
ncbi:phenylacetate--CoA ligase family protein [Catalinimonas niigatensis]|uniref:phenylacetate--CoA ligase family protein n=1 Tax=Catalinimonas niigatensis TaxID=1397264 RepID=UPI00266634D1|nr:hypothetical protein [Catalinimonas niigatensis]WPP51591.1 hypothetical protein PZB72_04220 [Catalinimonas niigatensis]